MCGISGQIDFVNQKNYIKDMTEALTSRGPDDFGYYFHKDISHSLNLGHRRLEILDIKNGKQPMSLENNKYTIVFNGEIYNWKYLKNKLSELGYTFLTKNSDTEVLLLGYKHWGTKISNYLNGMWAFCIYDKIKNILFLSRDRFGEKPLYYCFNSKNFIFSSQVNSILKNKNQNFSISEINLAKYCGYGYFPSNLTPFNEIRKIIPGSNLVFDLNNKSFSSNQYWNFELNPDYSKKESYWKEQIYCLLEKSVQDRLVADTDVGIFLSGGLDSTIITALATKNSKKKINSFSIGFKEKTFDESIYSNFISKKFSTNHYNQIIDKSLALQSNKELLEKIDEPISDSSLISYYTLCKLASKYNKVVLGGDASDELFLGYDTFKALKYAKTLKKFKLNNLNPVIRNIINFLPASKSHMGLQFKLKRFFMDNFENIDLLNCKWLSPIPIELINSIFSKNYDYSDIFSEVIDEWDKLSGFKKTSEDKSIYFYNKFFLTNQMMVKIDRLSMMNSLEVRTPFLDYDFVDCVSKIPNEFKLKNNTTKYILKKTFESLCGTETVYRKKVGFSFPLEKFFSENIINFKIESNYLKKKNLNNKLENFNNIDRMIKWNLIILDNFAKKYI